MIARSYKVDCLLFAYQIMSGLHTEAVSVNVTVASVVTTTLGFSHQKMWAGGDGT